MRAENIVFSVGFDDGVLKESEYALDFVDGTVASDVDSDIVAVLGDSVHSYY